jgi:tetrapyrrole methylase family protein/MazG family protein
LPLPQDLSRFEALVEIIAKLRAPDGCPWDRQQTHVSLRENLLGECYEVLEAIDEGDPAHLCDELGDLLMQIVFHAQMAAEAGDFGVGEVLKQSERAEGTSILESVPKQMPSLSYSQEIQRRVARVGFDWEDVDGVIEKLGEEVREYRQAVSQQERVQEYGDLLFTLVNVARREGIDSEAALREANRRFFRRFTYMEGICRQRGLSFAAMSFDEQNALWEEAKRGVEGTGRGK